MPLIGADRCTHSGLHSGTCNSSFVDYYHNIGISGYQLADIEPSAPPGCAAASLIHLFSLLHCYNRWM